MEFNFDLERLIRIYLNCDDTSEITPSNALSTEDFIILDAEEDCTDNYRESRRWSVTEDPIQQHASLEKRLIHIPVKQQIAHLYDETDNQCLQDCHSTTQSQVCCCYCYFTCSTTVELKHHQTHFHSVKPHVNFNDTSDLPTFCEDSINNNQIPGVVQRNFINQSASTQLNWFEGFD